MNRMKPCRVHDKFLLRQPAETSWKAEWSARRDIGIGLSSVNKDSFIMKRVSILAVLTSALALCAALPPLPATAEPILGEESINVPDSAPKKQRGNDALALFKAKDYEGALKLWKEIVENNADMPPAQVIMAQLFLQAGLPKDAQAALEQAILDAPDDPEPYMFMATLALRDRDPTKAEAQLRKAGELLPKFTKSDKRRSALQLRIQSGVAAVAQSRNDWAGAQKSLETALSLDPKNPATLQQLTYCMFQQKNVEGALAKLREAAKNDPKMPVPEAVLVQFYQQSADVENVKKWMAAAIAAAPKSARTRLVLAQCALEAGLMEDAQKNAVAAMKLDPKSLEAEFLRGLVALCDKDYRTAESYFESAMKRAPAGGAFPISNNLALALIEQDDEAKGRRALEYAEANAKQYADSANAASTYGWVLYRLKRLDDAEKALQTAVAAGPMSVDTAYYMARVMVDRGRKADAKKLLETALKLPGRSMFRQDAEDLLQELKK
jgi:tetratricopeptide (TPR) repeat protein